MSICCLLIFPQTANASHPRLLQAWGMTGLSHAHCCSCALQEHQSSAHNHNHDTNTNNLGISCVGRIYARDRKRPPSAKPHSIWHLLSPPRAPCSPRAGPGLYQSQAGLLTLWAAGWRNPSLHLHWRFPGVGMDPYSVIWPIPRHVPTLSLYPGKGGGPQWNPPHYRYHTGKGKERKLILCHCGSCRLVGADVGHMLWIPLPNSQHFPYTA